MTGNLSTHQVSPCPSFGIVKLTPQKQAILDVEINPESNINLLQIRDLLFIRQKNSSLWYGFTSGEPLLAEMAVHIQDFLHVALTSTILDDGQDKHPKQTQSLHCPDLWLGFTIRKYHHNQSSGVSLSKSSSRKLSDVFATSIALVIPPLGACAHFGACADHGGGGSLC